MQLMYVLFSQNPKRIAERGQSTVEYIMVTLAAATLAAALIKVMAGMGKIASIFDRIIDSVLGLF
jgi:hypothetical protein